MRIAWRVSPRLGPGQKKLIRVLALQDRKELREIWYFLHTPLAPLGNPAEPVAAGTLPHFHVAAVPSLIACANRAPVSLLFYKKINASAEQRHRNTEKQTD